jgi:hypothetical protein
MINQVRFLREAGCPFELLLLFANRFSFNPPQAQLQALIYHRDGRKKKSAIPRGYCLDASPKPVGASCGSSSYSPIDQERSAKRRRNDERRNASEDKSIRGRA